MNELDLILGNRPSLQIYLVKEGEKWLPIESVEPVIGSQLTRVLQLSHDSRRPQDRRGVEVGERLTYHEPLETGYWVRPSEWVVIKVFRYQADITGLSEFPEFRDIEIAYCEKQALLPVEIEEQSYQIKVIKQEATEFFKHLSSMSLNEAQDYFSVETGEQNND